MQQSLSENFFLKHYKDLPVGVIAISINKNITLCNDYVSKLLNLSINQIIGKPYNYILPTISIIDKFVQGEKLNFDSITVKINNNNMLFFPLFLEQFDNERNIIGILANDYSSNSFSLNNQSFQKVLDSSLDEIFITNGKGDILFINATAEALYGESPKNLVGRNVLELENRGYFSPSLFPIVQERREKVSMIQRTKMGTSHHVIAYPSFNKDLELTNVVFNARDITEVKHLREKIERSENLINTYKTEVQEMQKYQGDDNDFVSFAPKMLKIKQTIEKVAPFNTTILITGESGVGKGVIANEIHKKSHRKDKKIVHVNCGAIPEALIESELFGYEGGSFTGSKKEGAKGIFEYANGGTLFLDEIGEIPLHLQVKLLKVLQENKIQRVGGNKSIEIDSRIIAATNQNLNKLIKAGEFREDLYYRLNVIPIHIPPLRKRQEDITYMLNLFIDEYNKKYNAAKYLSLVAENLLARYSWPGNVRELENLVERMVITSNQDEIKASDLPDDIVMLNDSQNSISVHNVITLKQAQQEMEKQLVQKAYEINSNSYKVAKMLGVNQSTAHRKINQYLKDGNR